MTAANAPAPATQSERALLGAILQEPDAVLPVVESAGLTAASFTDAVCVRALEAVARLRAGRVVVDLVSIAEEMDGDDGTNVVELGDCMALCPTAAHAEHYARQVAEAERRRRLSAAATMAAEQLAKGGAVDVVAGQLKDAGQAAESAGAGTQIVSAVDFLAEPIPEPPQVIHGVLRAEQVGMMSAPSKAGKSWLLLMLANAVASGMSWLRWPTTQGRVLYINAELSRFDLQKRLERIAEALDLTAIPPMLDVWHMKGTRKTIGQLIPAIVERQRVAGRYALVVPDPLYSFNGEREENSNTEMAVTMAELSELTERTGAGCWISHHFSKGGQASKSHLDRGSGAGVLARSPDTVMSMTEHGETDCFSVETTCRSFAKPEGFVVRWEYPLWQIALGLDPNDLKRQPGRSARFTVKQIADLLPADGLTHADWRAKAEAELGCKRTTFNGLLAKAKAEGLVMLGFGRYVPGTDGDDDGQVLSAGLRASLGDG